MGALYQLGATASRVERRRSGAARRSRGEGSRASVSGALRAARTPPEELTAVEGLVLFELAGREGGLHPFVRRVPDLPQLVAPLTGGRGAVRGVLVAQGRERLVVLLHDLAELLLLGLGEAELLGQALGGALGTELGPLPRAVHLFLPAFVVDAIEDVSHGGFEDGIRDVGGSGHLLLVTCGSGRRGAPRRVQRGGEQGHALFERTDAVRQGLQLLVVLLGGDGEAGRPRRALPLGGGGRALGRVGQARDAAEEGADGGG